MLCFTLLILSFYHINYFTYEQLFCVIQVLLYAASRGDKKQIQECLKGGANVNYQNDVSYVTSIQILASFVCLIISETSISKHSD